MKRIACLWLLILILLSACVNPSEEVTSESTPPVSTWWISTPEPTPENYTPEPTPFLSYEDYFAQRIDYGDVLYEDNLLIFVSDSDPAVMLAQKLVPNNSLAPSSMAMKSLADHCLYSFWAEAEEGVVLYRLYCPTETLDLIYTISKEEFEEKYFYTPQTEAAADWLRCEVGERTCLLGSVVPYSNEEFLWYAYNKEFLERYDEVMSHPEDYPQYFEEGPMGDWFDIVSLLETSDCCHTEAHYVDVASGRHDFRPQGVYITYGYWWE